MIELEIIVLILASVTLVLELAATKRRSRKINLIIEGSATTTAIVCVSGVILSVLPATFLIIAILQLAIAVMNCYSQKR